MRALLRNNKHRWCLVAVLAAVGVEIVVKQDWDFAGKNPRIGSLRRNNWVVGLELLEIFDAHIQVVVGATKCKVDCNDANLADRCASWVEVSNKALVLRFEQVGPATWHRLASQGLRVDKEAQRSRVNGEPVAFCVFQ